MAESATQDFWPVKKIGACLQKNRRHDETCRNRNSPAQKWLKIVASTIELVILAPRQLLDSFSRVSAFLTRGCMRQARRVHRERSSAELVLLAKAACGSLKSLSGDESRLTGCDCHPFRKLNPVAVDPCWGWLSNSGAPAFSAAARSGSCSKTDAGKAVKCWTLE